MGNFCFNLIKWFNLKSENHFSCFVAVIWAKHSLVVPNFIIKSLNAIYQWNMMALMVKVWTSQLKQNDLLLALNCFLQTTGFNEVSISVFVTRTLLVSCKVQILVFHFMLQTYSVLKLILVISDDIDAILITFRFALHLNGTITKFCFNLKVCGLPL